METVHNVHEHTLSKAVCVYVDEEIFFRSSLALCVCVTERKGSELSLHSVLPSSLLSSMKYARIGESEWLQYYKSHKRRPSEPSSSPN